ncbi:glutamate transport system substrate-binding protein [Kineosphaera limosa]|uniref:Glutamate ABC transporter substrate-binding protein n=1 Tax=Kineosphaera limosa NBRC 100340 TaxID=1184609 RepID=K6WSZ3_9MICO|nr:glutamate ABC transporter substrate-binding protein [Kineosphaera limosa]NYE01472.1 glutamate transport system substrate-binding protein [Kineosphaera limosa]GAB95217.1 glutamate ABC transporter substrate-binding protein [Kineosphaera limosa NBRC 100340]
MKKTRIGLMAIVSAAALALSACGAGTEDAGGGTGDSTAGGGATGPLRVGIKFDQPGLGLQEGANYTGFDVEVANYIGQQLGRGVQFSEAPTPQRETLLRTDQVDMIVATYSITDERKQQVSFAGPYLIAGQDLLVRENETAITGPETLEGKTLCSVRGSTPAQRVQKEHPGVQLQEYDTYSNCVEELVNGTVDAVTTDDVILAGFAAQPQFSGKVKLVGNPFSQENLGVGVQKDNEQLCNQVTDALKQMIDSGAWQQKVDEVFGAAGYKPGPGNPPTPTCQRA